MADLPARVRGAVAPLATAEAVDLVDVQVKGAGRGRLVRVVVARKGGVDVGTCQRLSSAVGDALEAEDELDGYQLEVTSPGVDHPLRDHAAFDRVEGLPVLVHRATAAGVAEITGTVRAALADVVVLDVAGDEVRVPYSEIATARQRLPW